MDAHSLLEEFQKIEEELDRLPDALERLNKLKKDTKKTIKQADRRKSNGSILAEALSKAKMSATFITLETLKHNIYDSFSRGGTFSGGEKDFPADYFTAFIQAAEESLRVPVKFNKNGTHVSIHLLENCRDSLGSVDMYFAAVQAARSDSGIPGPIEDSQKSWELLYDNKYKTKKYSEIMTRRLRLIPDSKAPWWYFYEHGNTHFSNNKKDTYPYPSYGPPKYITYIENRVKTKLKNKVQEIISQEKEHVETTLSHLMFVLEKIKKLINSLDNIDYEQLKELIDNQIKQHYDRVDIEKDLDEEFYRKVEQFFKTKMNKEIRVYGLQKYSSGLIKRMRVRDVGKKLGLPGVSI